MVFQNYAIFPHLNVFENVAFPLRARKMGKAQIKEKVVWALDMVQLGAFGERFARQLSGGQQQRVAIARAIVFQPRLVLMDEPLGALDKNLHLNMQTEIRDIQQRLGTTVIYVTHDQQEALTMSDQVAIMNHGRVEQIGPSREVYERPANGFVGKFLGESQSDRRGGRYRGAAAAPGMTSPRCRPGWRRGRRPACSCVRRSWRSVPRRTPWGRTRTGWRPGWNGSASWATICAATLMPGGRR
jgi:ABC-type sugar transport system ATPase subunit